MKHKHSILYFSPTVKEGIYSLSPDDFRQISVFSVDEFEEALKSGGNISLLIFRWLEHGSFTLESLKELLSNLGADDLPLFVLTDSDDLQDKLRAYEVGCDDYITTKIEQDEFEARICRSIEHKIANDQLRVTAKDANDMVMIAMTNSSDIGVANQFLLDSAQCSNIDELGMLFFQVVNGYALNCSIQLRSAFGVKNMEPNGMPKALESQLLDKLKDSGRFYDFGRRTVINFDRASVLIKNMPIEDSQQYGRIKDNIFPIIQGLNDRTKSIDNIYQLTQQRDLLVKLTEHVQCSITSFDESIHFLMTGIASVVEEMADELSEAVSLLGFSEEQEAFIEKIANKGILATGDIFNKRNTIDDGFRGFIKQLEVLLNESGDQPLLNPKRINMILSDL